MSAAARRPAPGAADMLVPPLWASRAGAPGAGPLSAEEAALVERIIASRSAAEPGAMLAVVGKPAAPCVLLAGWATRFRMMADGRRQILGILLPGDEISPALQPQGQLSPYSVAAITPVQVAATHELRQRLLALDGRFSRLHAGCLAALHATLGGSFDQVVRVGRQTAYDRLGHFLLELCHRLRAIGHASGHSFRLPLTQETIGDAVGLSYVHVNRTLQEMRRNRMIETHGGWITILEPETLATLTEFSGPASVLPASALPASVLPGRAAPRPARGGRASLAFGAPS